MAKKAIGEGIWAAYKPKGPTSYDILRQIKKATGIKKVGHAGTLDPLARGILVVGVGRAATRQLGEVVKKEKEYAAKIKLGQSSSTDDAEGTKTEFKIINQPSCQEVDRAVSKFIGRTWQSPPIFSAVKIRGQEAYKRARRGEKVVMSKRRVEIKKIKIISYHWPYLKLQVITGPGVYIRSLARDIGRTLKVGGYLADLERTRVGQFTKKSARKF
ncbi:MAG: tRNA pseudouridine(55) synthase TruB [Parcubacteria group bacterium CG1_02_42_13]|nr:MAG: tRNA pseudouridine(55) synthase TruB [Parcubacteria group bacterium CG1_02_42_13]